MRERINLLQGHVAELIAAGEVVERPASVVKELVENAIDSGADAITVEIKDGGISYIRVSDNGCGILRQDVPTAFLRHATSKISTEEDLGHIGTLGFRGEALAAISSVCRVELITRPREEVAGTRFCIEGGSAGEAEDAGCPVGTTIVVRDIFFNTPARMKFLKKNVTEGNSVEGVMQKVALSHPHISFRFVRDGVDKLHTPGTGKLQDTIFSLFGKTVATSLIPVSYQEGYYRVEGFISKPQLAKSNRTLQHFYINGRLVKTKTGMVALEQGYRGVLMSGKFPACFLFVTMPQELVDVNVHPAKIEVRFAAEKEVFGAIYAATRSAIANYSDQTAAALGSAMSSLAGQRSSAPQTAVATAVKPDTLTEKKAAEGLRSERMSADEFRRRFGSARPDAALAKTGVGRERDLSLHAPTGTVEVQNGQYTQQLPAAVTKLLRENMARQAARSRQLDIEVEEPDLQPRQDRAPAPVSPPPAAATPPQNADAAPVCTPATPVSAPDQLALAPHETEEQQEPVPTVIGEVFKTYILCQSGNSLFIVDKHAAHERILYERLRQEWGSIDRQMLLDPVSVTLSKEEIDAVVASRQLLQDAGFVAEEFGQNTVVVREIPVFLEQVGLADIFEEIASNLLTTQGQAVQASHLDWLFQSISCRGAIKGGDRSSLYELQQLIEQIYRTGIIKYCPHGRPIVIEMTRTDFERQFGRQ
ncbi:DNA mismatch repair endonuclease MutL [Neobittarella massiliensis]|uniref:DNA mismatch repair protein MutL n=1 Tax=Neobittarella massiliensis (ex Bilen et al. 2018) TaxID=2041842 RepID=A0A8J6INP1_9FIRM|nr:DNA mismatch repair endonuclease MutL [Neobittarella massiliensis]MBC3515653.1 DNA mismatch repair endonuclease MutL [Neobittarella massiliensis]